MKNNVRKIKDLLNLNSKARILYSESDWNLVQEKNILYIFSNDNLSYDDNRELYVSELSSAEAIIELLPDDKISVYEFSDLYQFNCLNCLAFFIKLINLGLKKNGYENTLTEELFDNPQSYKSNKVQNKNFELKSVNGVQCTVYSFELNGKKIQGNGTFIKYTFFDKIESSVETIEDLMSLYVELTILIGKACFAGKDDGYLPCDPWATDITKERLMGEGRSIVRTTLKKEFQ